MFVDETLVRLDLRITAESDLDPDAPVTLRIAGEAKEVIDGGIVQIRLPTNAMIDYAGSEKQPYVPVGDEVAAHGEWSVPSMAVGDTWEETVEIPAAPAGYYLVSVTAETYGPESDHGPMLSEDVYTQAWMFISDTGGQLTDVFEDSIFPDGTRAVPGKLTSLTELEGRPPGTGDKVYLSVAYYDGRRGKRGYQPAVDSRVLGISSSGRIRSETVPEDGIVAFDCRGWWIGNGYVPETPFVTGKSGFVRFWSAHSSDCGDTISVYGRRVDYMPWRNLDLSAINLISHTGHTRGRVNWEVDLTRTDAVYRRRWWGNKIIFGRYSYHNGWVAGHEYTHALQDEGMGGLWTTKNCRKHSVYLESSYTCAFQEGVADYGGNIGAPDEGFNWEDFYTRGSKRKPMVEGHVAALLWDLVDPENETGDATTYSGRYIFKVFSTCEVLHGGWRKRNDVADFVWCLENRIDKPLHRRIFPNTMIPRDVEELATEPPDWNADHIRSTWLKNLR